MEHISTIVQEALDRHADQMEPESPIVAEQIREQSEKIVELPVRQEISDRGLRLVC